MTDGQPILKTSLLDLLYELRDQQMPLIIGGGYGLYLKQVSLQETSSFTTLIPGELWPAPRATEDLDILLRTEVVVDANRMRPIQAALDRLGYVAIPGAEYMQFAKPLGRGMTVKVDLLTGPLGPFENDPQVKVDKRRVRPRGSVKLHAHWMNEALGFQDDTLAIPVRGVLSSGQDYEAVVHVPQAFTLLLMKLHAFRDRRMDPEKDMARHHALDIYRIVAMMTDDEFEQTRHRTRQHEGEEVIVEARRIVQEHFTSTESLGALRLREHQLWTEGMALAEFLSAMEDLFHVIPPEFFGIGLPGQLADGWKGRPADAYGLYQGYAEKVECFQAWLRAVQVTGDTVNEAMLFWRRYIGEVVSAVCSTPTPGREWHTPAQVIDLLCMAYCKATDFLAVAMEMPNHNIDSRRLRQSTKMILAFCHGKEGIDFRGIKSDANRRAYDDALTDIVRLRDMLAAAEALQAHAHTDQDKQGRSMTDATDMLETAITGLLRWIPAAWQTYRPDDLTETQSQALYLLIGAGMVERRCHGRLWMLNHPVMIEYVFTATGEYGAAEALEKLSAAMWADWHEAYDTWTKGDTGHVSPFYAEQLEPSEWRLTDQGILARNDLGGDRVARGRVFDFVLKRGFFDGQPRLMPGGRITQHKPVRGAGALVSMEKVELDADIRSTVNVGNWSEGADVFAKAFGQICTAQSQAAAQGGQGEATAPIGTKPPAKPPLARAQQREPALTEDQVTILAYLREKNMALKQEAIVKAVHRTEKTVRRDLKVLRKHGYINRPSGKRSGDAITNKGLARLASTSTGASSA